MIHGIGGVRGVPEPSDVDRKAKQEGPLAGAEIAAGQDSAVEVEQGANGGPSIVRWTDEDGLAHEGSLNPGESLTIGLPGGSTATLSLGEEGVAVSYRGEDYALSESGDEVELSADEGFISGLGRSPQASEPPPGRINISFQHN